MIINHNIILVTITKEINMKRKKLIGLTTVLVLLICVVTATLTACTDSGKNNSNDSRIQLTTSNYDQYLDVNTTCRGTVAASLRGFYECVMSAATVSSTSPLIRFYGCKITVNISVAIYYETIHLKTVTNRLTVNLDFGGTGNASKTDSCEATHGSDNFLITSANRFVITDSSIEAVSGYIEIS